MSMFHATAGKLNALPLFQSLNHVLSLKITNNQTNILQLLRPLLVLMSDNIYAEWE